MHDDLKVSEVAQLLRVSEAAVRSWIKRGAITAFSVSRTESARPIYRITRTAVDDFRTARVVTLQEKQCVKRKKRRNEAIDVHPYF